MVGIRLLLVMAAMVSLSACATSRSVVMPDMAVGTNPEQGVAVRIDVVEDVRRFEASPSSPDIPSLSGNDRVVPSIVARAVARKRNGYGMALGDVLLPEGQTVSGLVGKAIAQGFRQAGYRVIGSGEPGYDQAMPVNARITEFWSWFSPGFSSVIIHNRGRVDLSGSLPELEKGQAIQSDVSESMMAVFEDDWRMIVGKGLKRLSEKVEEVFRRP